MSDRKEHESLSEWVDTAMQNQGLGIRDVAEKLDLTYEHVRRIVRGEAIPSRYILKPLCELLGLNYEDVETLAMAERIRKKYGAIQVDILPRNAAFEPVEKVWNKLNDKQRRDALTMMQGWAKNNRTEKGMHVE